LNRHRTAGELLEVRAGDSVFLADPPGFQLSVVDVAADGLDVEVQNLGRLLDCI
jgi:hypothetical protein